MRRNYKNAAGLIVPFRGWCQMATKTPTKPSVTQQCTKTKTTRRGQTGIGTDRRTNTSMGMRVLVATCGHWPRTTSFVVARDQRLAVRGKKTARPCNFADRKGSTCCCDGATHRSEHLRMRQADEDAGIQRMRGCAGCRGLRVRVSDVNGAWWKRSGGAWHGGKESSCREDVVTCCCCGTRTRTGAQTLGGERTRRRHLRWSRSGGGWGGGWGG